MKRFLVMFTVVGVVASSLATAEAKKPTRSERTVVGHYGPYPAPVTGCNSALGSFACLVVHTRPTEWFFTAKVTDAHGLPVFVEVQDDAGRHAYFCGQTTRPIAINPKSTLSFHIGLDNWGLSGNCPANRIKTTGTIRVTLSNVP